MKVFLSNLVFVKNICHMLKVKDLNLKLLDYLDIKVTKYFESRRLSEIRLFLHFGPSVFVTELSRYVQIVPLCAERA